jgi:hypothetical protein
MNTGIISARSNSAKDICSNVINEFEMAYNYQKVKNLDRLDKAWRRYFPVDFGKWDGLKDQMQEEYRSIAQFDIVGPKTDILVGSMIADLPDPSWSPVVGQKTILTEAIAKVFHEDKEIGNFDDTLMKTFRNGAVQCGDVMMCESFESGEPRITIKLLNSRRVIWEPYWETEDDRDASVVFYYQFMTPDKIMKQYSFATDEIKRELENYRKDKSNYPQNDANKETPYYHGRNGDEFMVIDKHYVENIKTTRLVGRAYDSEEFIPFPINKSREYLELFAELNGIDWTTVYEDIYQDKVHKVSTVIRELIKAEVQIDKKSSVQTHGLPIYHFTFFRHEGQDMGIPEAMAGVEDTINKRESLVTELISKANGGSDLVNEKMFNGDQRKFDKWNKNKNKPGHSEPVDLDAVKNPMYKIAQNQYPSSVVDQIDRMYERVLPIVSRVSDALSSISDPNDSGILFERKYQTNLIANTLSNRAMRQFINNIAEGYFYQFQITYDGYEKKVGLDGGKSITLNRESGGKIYNSVKSIPRCSVVIVENKKSATHQMRWRSVWAEMLQTIDPNVAQPYYMMALKNFFETIEMTDNDKEISKAMGELMMVSARLSVVSNITGLQTKIQGDTLQSAQIDMQMQMIFNQIQAQMAAEQQQQVQYQEEATTQINYPQGNINMNQSPIEAESGSTAQIPPAETGVLA